MYVARAVFLSSTSTSTSSVGACDPEANESPGLSSGTWTGAVAACLDELKKYLRSEADPHTLHLPGFLRRDGFPAWKRCRIPTTNCGTGRVAGELTEWVTPAHIECGKPWNLGLEYIIMSQLAKTRAVCGSQNWNPTFPCLPSPCSLFYLFFCLCFPFDILCLHGTSPFA